MAEGSPNYDVIVIGGGPAGYVAAIRCAQLQLKTACVDDWSDARGDPSLGGTCLNVGCIPSKALLESSELYARAHSGKLHGLKFRHLEADVPAMIERKNKVVKTLTRGVDQLLKAAGVDCFHGRGRVLPDLAVEVSSGRTLSQLGRARSVILACGSMPMELPVAPLQGDVVVDSAGALEWTTVPKKLAVIGAGVIGLELGSVWRRLGAEVTMIEALDSFLPATDRQIAASAARTFRNQGLDIRLATKVLGLEHKEGEVRLYCGDSKGKREMRVDRVIVAAGRRPNLGDTLGGGLEAERDASGRLRVDKYCQTSVVGLYAIGDLVSGPMLAHKGSKEGVALAEYLAGASKNPVQRDLIPSVIYTHPEISWVGATEQELSDQGQDFRVGVFPFAANGRARSAGHEEGMVKILADGRSHTVLGVHIFGAQSSELIASATLAMEFQATTEDLIHGVFAHPTLSEAIHEAVLAVHGRPLHISARS